MDPDFDYESTFEYQSERAQEELVNEFLNKTNCSYEQASVMAEAYLDGLPGAHFYFDKYDLGELHAYAFDKRAFKDAYYESIKDVFENDCYYRS